MPVRDLRKRLLDFTGFSAPLQARCHSSLLVTTSPSRSVACSSHACRASRRGLDQNLAGEGGRRRRDDRPRRRGCNVRRYATGAHDPRLAPCVAHCSMPNGNFCSLPPSSALLEARVVLLVDLAPRLHAPSRRRHLGVLPRPIHQPVLLPCRRIELGQLLPRVWVEAGGTLLSRFAPFCFPVRGRTAPLFTVFGSKREPQNPTTAASPSAPAAYLAMQAARAADA